MDQLDELHYAPRRAHAYQVGLVAIWAAPAVIVALALAGPVRYAFIVVALASLVWAIRRSLRLALIVNRKEVRIVNYLRTYEVRWSDVAAVAPAAIMIRPALAFILRDGTGRPVQVTQDARRGWSSLESQLRSFAPADVRFLQDKTAALRTGTCPRCGKKMLAPDLDGAGLRHCWACGADVPDDAATSVDS